MCRSIHTLYNFEPPATDDEVRAAALQYVRKVSGFTKPSRANAVAFERAVDAVGGRDGPAPRRARHVRLSEGSRARGGEGAGSRLATSSRVMT